MTKKALVVFSGGQDSTTCLFWALKEFDEVETLCFDYGQRHRIEQDAARAIAENAGVPFTLLNLDLLKQITHNSLTDTAMNVDENKPEHTPPNTLVEGRNMLFLTFAAIFAKGKNIPNLVTGVGQADYSGYPDCRDEFIRSLNQTLNLSMDYQFTIHTPLMWKTKEDIWALSDELGVFDLVRTQTVTCYNGIKGDGCGHCPACKLRKAGLESYLQLKNQGCLKSQNACESGHPEFISGSDIQYFGILNQVQDDGINDFRDNLIRNFKLGTIL